MTQATALVWFRRDLRCDDHPALYAAAHSSLPLIGLYIWENEDRAEPRRAAFIGQCLADLQQNLAAHRIPLFVFEGDAETVLPEFAARCRAAQIVCGEARDRRTAARDTRLAARLVSDGITFKPLPDRIVAQTAADRLLPFPAFRNGWLADAPKDDAALRLPEVLPAQNALPQHLRQAPPLPDCAQPLPLQGGVQAAEKLLSAFLGKLPNYPYARDFPALNSTSQLSPHIAFGTLSPRRLFAAAQADGSAAARLWQDGLIRREYAQHYAFYSPTSAEICPMPSEYADHPALLCWQNGETGYPLIDAAMRKLSSSGLLHHRLRRLAAQFLVHHAGIPAAAGEAWFARQLLDFDAASNHWHWQTVTQDTLPPLTVQAQKLDPNGRFVRRYVPELAHLGKEWIHTPFAAPFSLETNGYPPPLPPES